MPKKGINTYLRDGRAPVPLKESVSRVMSANKAKNTKPELSLRKVLWGKGLKGYRLHLKMIPGRPDIAFPSKKLAIFVNGCYWHRCPNCAPHYPLTNQDFWSKKFDANIQRDKKKVQELEKNNWRVITVWECQIKNQLDHQVCKIVEAFNKAV